MHCNLVLQEFTAQREFPFRPCSISTDTSFMMSRLMFWRTSDVISSSMRFSEGRRKQFAVLLGQKYESHTFSQENPSCFWSAECSVSWRETARQSACRYVAVLSLCLSVCLSVCLSLSFCLSLSLSHFILRIYLRTSSFLYPLPSCISMCCSYSSYSHVQVVLLAHLDVINTYR